ncbi:glycoside hydrolase family 97 catalytic domain-containing protein [Streptomyces sp. NBC_01460]|uniref:glycoside hydrolase family 97 catalytic domain-containing protein n=1 Tax=Streptomyces sp. NBC_01460 TaxID=2903875 RepID=UPI002E31D14F|nr:glycoside hydrolase family 97 catalytic domain-containing protein [Streptomyces sp. NBC_01460]
MREGKFRTALLSTYALTAALAAAVLPAVPTHAAAAAPVTTWTVTGPTSGSPVSAQVSLHADGGELSFGVSRLGTTVLSPALIGIDTTAADLSKDLAFTGRQDRTVTESYTMTTGKKRTQQTAYTQTTLSFTGAGGARLDVVVRVSSTGAAYRYTLPGSGSVTVEREASSWAVPTSANAWVVPGHREDQGQWLRTTAGAAPAGDYAVPALFQVGSNYALLAETDLDGRYAGSRLTHQAGSGTYSTKITNAPVTATLPLSTPWRTAAVGDLAAVTTSTLVDDLAPPSKVSDTSWIKPGASAWSWLTEHSSPSDPARQRKYIDFAQHHGWDYVLVDEGWQSSWMPDLVDYADARGVKLIAWFNSSALQTAEQRERWLPLVKSWGVAGVKIDFSYEYTQPTLKWYDTVLARTAQLELLVNFHGAATARGMQRTWPHVMTGEAVYGAEQQNNRAARNTVLPFTRNVVSSMDFTPVVFSLSNRDTTDAHELATAVVFESGWQHYADNPESYQSRPEALRILDQLPTAWDETRLLAGSPGQETYMARRAGGRWYVGGISAVAAKTFQSPLSFLGGGQWLLETVRDGPGPLVRETRVVTAGDTLSVPLQRNGGFASAVCPYTAGMTTCGSPDSDGLLKGQESGLCVDVPNSTQTNGTDVRLADCNGDSNQLWTQNASRQLTVFAGKCLDVDGGATADGTAVQIWDCNSSGAQQWSVNSDGSAVNPMSGKCLTARDHGTADGTALVIRGCDGGAHQKWARGAATGLVKGQGSQRCLDVPNNETGNGTRPALWDCNGGANQTWTSTASNQLRVYPTECLDVSGGATVDGSAVVITDCTGATSQKWRVMSSGAIVNVASGKCLDAYEGGTVNGTQAIIWPCNGAANQRWVHPG